MMDDLKEPTSIFLDIYYSAETEPGFVKRFPGEAFFIAYLKLKGVYEKEREKILKEFDGISKSKFEEDYPMNDWPDLQTQIEAVSNIVGGYSPNVLGKYNIQHFENEYLTKALKYYYEKTGYKSGLIISVKSLSNEDYESLEDLIITVGKSSIKKKLLEEVGNHLLLSDTYTAPGKKLVKSTALACTKVYYELYNGKGMVDSRKLKKRVLIDYRFEIYADLSRPKALRRAKKAINRWISTKKRSENDFHLK